MSRVRQVVKKVIIGAAAVAALFALFLWTLQETESTPYVIGQELLTGWHVTVERARNPDDPLVSLTPPRELTMSLFQQVFERTMESMNAPVGYGIALILQREFARGMAGLVEPEELADLARDAGLERATLVPLCLAVRRGSTSDEPRRIFYVVFDLPVLRRFRDDVGQYLETRGGDHTTFDPTSLVPILYLAATDGGFRGRPSDPQTADQECVAPVELGSY